MNATMMIEKERNLKYVELSLDENGPSLNEFLTLEFASQFC